MTRRLKILSVIALAVLTLTVISESIPTPTFIGPVEIDSLIVIPLMPGYVVYIIVTGDIHGWQPGPIGYGGRVAVSAFFNILFWLFITSKLLKRKANNLVE